jgi:TATA-box binding protein (TBP) (component of TFIID and TFIIIB)
MNTQITTRTLVGKTKFVSGQTTNLEVDECLKFFSQHIENGKTKNSILQLRTGFKNSFTCDLYLVAFNKKISMKICKNGSFQFTGCITIDCAYAAIQYILSLLKELYPTHYVDKECHIYIYEVMSNFRLDLQRRVKQTRLLNFFETISLDYPNYKCFRSTNCAALNCKYSLEPLEVLERQVYVYNEKEFVECVPYNKSITNRQLSIDEAKDYYVTFLIFESGKVIVSGINENIVEKICLKFKTLMEDYFSKHVLDQPLVLLPNPPVNNKKRSCYERIVLIHIEEDQYVIVRGKSSYISNRKNKLSSKYSYCRVVYDKECCNVNVFKEMKQMVNAKPDIHFSNVVLTTKLQENVVVSYIDLCNHI